MLPIKVSTTIILITLLFITAEARKYTNSLTLPVFRREGAWLFLDRMHIDPGFMSINFGLKFVSNNPKPNSLYEFDLVAIPASVWDLSRVKKCDRNGLSQEQQKLINQKEFTIHASLYQANSFSFSTQSKLQITQQQTYHFVLRHCSKTILNDGYGRQVKLEIDLNIQNNERYHSSTQSAYSWLLPILIIIGGVMLKMLYSDVQDDGDNWLKWTLKLSLWIGVGSILFKYLGFVVYAYISGSQYHFFDFMFLFLHSIADSALIIILLLLSFGWTVTFKNSMDFDIYVPLSFMLGIVNIIMTLLNKITDGQYDKHHMFDTIPAYVMIGFRLLAFLIFLGGIAKVLINLKSDERTIRRYIIQLGILGSIYLTFVPALVYLATFIEAKNRKQFMYFGIQLIKLVINVWLAYLCGRKSSAYRKIIDKSFMEKGDKFY